ncbi:MAG: hypothetical protein AAFR61_04400 [Bacteroidota bacterium]
MKKRVKNLIGISLLALGLMGTVWALVDTVETVQTDLAAQEEVIDMDKMISVLP